MFGMTVMMNPGGPWTMSNEIMMCGVCFDVKDEDGEVEEGTKGFGGCYYSDSDGNPYFDAHYMGTIEA